MYKPFSEIFAVNVCPVYTLLSTVGFFTFSQLTVILFNVVLFPVLSVTVNVCVFVYVWLFSTPDTCGAIVSITIPSVETYLIFPALSITLA